MNAQQETVQKLKEILQNEQDQVQGKIQLESYKDNSLNLTGYTLTRVLDDILMVKYVDEDNTGEHICRDGILVPIASVEKAWRVGQVILAGSKCTIKPGDYVIFPSDKGIPCGNINGHRKVVFLNEERIFGVAQKTPI